MINQLFGSNNVKAKGELKSVNIPLSSSSSVEAWDTDGEDALHVPILSSQLKHQAEDDYEPELLNPFGVYLGDEKQATVVNINTSKLNAGIKNSGSQSVNQTIENDTTCNEAGSATIGSTAIPTLKPTTFAIGVYALNPAYSQILCEELAQLSDLPVQCLDASMEENCLKDITSKGVKVGMWVVNLSDDDESALLEHVLDASTESPTLYLSGSLSKHCKQKIQDFIQESEEDVSGTSMN
jgi:hypothetical protein